MQILAEAEDLPKTANIKTQLISLWTVPIFGGVLLIAFVAFPGFFPPMSPDMTADQVAAFYADNTAMVRFSMITFNLCGIMLLPLFMVIVVQMKRMATQSHVFAYCYLTAAVSGATLFALADIFYLVAAFRPDRNPELVMLLNDMAWIIFIAPVGACRRDEPACWRSRSTSTRSREPESGVSALGRALLARHRAWRWRRPSAPPIFRTGPLAWDGVVSFWLRNGAFALFVVVMFFVLRARAAPPGRRGGGGGAVSSAVTAPNDIGRRSGRLRAAGPRQASATSGSCSGSCPRSTPRSASSSSRWPG